MALAFTFDETAEQRKSERMTPYTEVPNDLLINLYRIRLTPNQVRVLAVIIRQTYGWHKSADTISNSQFMEHTGLRKWSVSRTKRELLDRKIVVKIRNKFSVNENWGHWRQLSKLTTTKKVVENVPKVVENVGHKRNSSKETKKNYTSPQTVTLCVSFRDFLKGIRQLDYHLISPPFLEIKPCEHCLNKADT